MKAKPIFAKAESVIEQFESELEAETVELSVLESGKCTDIEDVCANAIPHFDVRSEMGHEEDAAIKALVLDHAEPFVERTEQDERRLISKVSAHIVSRGVVPVLVQQLEGSANIIIPSFGEVASGKVGKVHEVNVVHFGKQTEAGPIA